MRPICTLEGPATSHSESDDEDEDVSDEEKSEVSDEESKSDDDVSSFLNRFLRPGGDFSK